MVLFASWEGWDHGFARGLSRHHAVEKIKSWLTVTGHRIDYRIVSWAFVQHCSS